jgi:hypothetical protein
VAASGDQTLRLTTLLPAGAKPRIVNEGPPVGQFRTEIDDHGAALGYFLNVIQARGAAEPDLRAELRQAADTLTVSLRHPRRGSAVIVFRKGKTSQGGQLGYAATGQPVPAPLAADVQRIEVTDAGPRWQ